MPGSIDWKKALCGICPAGCWVEAGLGNGRLMEIRPDTSHSLGMVCRLGRHAAEIVYSEHRLKYPLKRKGPKGSCDFERITWEEAYDAIAANLQRIKRESGPQAVAIYTGRGAQEQSLCDIFQPKGAAVSSASSVLFPFGSPNTTGVGALCYVSLHMIAPHVTMGRMQVDMFSDIENADLVLVWGTNPATDAPPADMDRLEAAVRRGAEVVVIDPRHTATARRTGAQWIPVRPGTDGALALSLIEVLIEEDLHDEDFARNWCHGFAALEQYVQHFKPEAVESVTGVPSATVRDLARRLGRAGGASLLMYTGLEYSNSGVQSARAVFTLFALAGQLDVPGGIGLSMLGDRFPINHADNLENPDLDLALGRRQFPVYTAYREESHAIALVESVLHGDPYRVRGLLVHGASILTSWPQTPVWRDTLAGLDFLVCIDRQLTADAAYADIVLPATTMFENLSYMVYGPIFCLRERVIEPIGEARNDYLIMSGLARQLGYGHLFPQTEEAAIRLVLEGSGYSLEDVREAGGWVAKTAGMMEYRKWEKGGLRRDGKPGFETPTGKFEIWSTILEEHGYDPLPRYIEPAEGPLSSSRVAMRYPLVFTSGARPENDFRSQHHGIEGLVQDHPEPVAEINERDAGDRGIIDGDLVRVTSPRGGVLFRARVTLDIMPGVVECMFGGGTPVGPEAWRKWNVNELTDMGNYDPISGFPVYKALLCEVELVEKAGRCGLTESASGDRTAVPVIVTGPQQKGAGPYPGRTVYLDNNATTRTAEAVRQAMMPYLDGNYGNPSSIHNPGREAREAVEMARRQVAALIGVRPRRTVFTGSGSEAANLAVKGVAYALRHRGRHIITTAVEHPAILNTCRFLERVGFQVTYLEVDGCGQLDPQRLRQAIRSDTILATIMMANNEVGTIQPIRELVSIARERGVLFHTDAVQAAGKIEVKVPDLGVDLLSLSGHKIHGPKGVGALYVGAGLELEPLIHGGNQEGGLRAGTENVAAIAGMGKAAEMAGTAWRDGDSVRHLRDRLEDGIGDLVPGAMLNGHREERLPNTLNMTLPGLRGESLVIAMGRYGISLSSGSACKSGDPEPAHVLLAMGRTVQEAHCSVRFSLYGQNSSEDIEAAIAVLGRVLEDRTTVRLTPCK